MEYSAIGTQITRYRKAASMTQEELGKAVGVSTQAVSRWECGGTPDIALLPAIADKLGVTIDTLFGRETGEAVDVFRLVRGWVHTLPQDQIIDQLNRLLWAGISQVPFHPNRVNVLPYLQSCRDVSMGEAAARNILCSNVEMDHGVYFGISAEDLSFSVLCPRPEPGYSVCFPEYEAARDFFDLLSQPDCLELMEFIMAQKDRFYSVDVLAKGIGREPGAITGLLDRLCQTGLINYTEVGMLEGPTRVYSIGCISALLPLLYLTRLLTQDRQLYYLNYGNRKKPLV